ncbi:MAG: gliding motility protein GldC [Bacteroidota bacterium]
MSANDIAKQSEIKIQVGLNNEKHPVKIQWSAEDSGLDGNKESKAMMLAFWDKIEKSTMRIDLWTTEMSVEEMQFFTYEILRSMADSYERSTSDKDLSKEIREFANKFGKSAKVLK